jgi:hypothetical protein
MHRTVFAAVPILERKPAAYVFNGRVYTQCRECGTQMEFLTECQSAWCQELRRGKIDAMKCLKSIVRSGEVGSDIKGLRSGEDKSNGEG